jgi:hypothetical protein
MYLDCLPNDLKRELQHCQNYTLAKSFINVLDDLYTIVTVERQDVYDKLLPEALDLVTKRMTQIIPADIKFTANAFRLSTYSFEYGGYIRITALHLMTPQRFVEIINNIYARQQKFFAVHIHHIARLNAVLLYEGCTEQIVYYTAVNRSEIRRVLLLDKTTIDKTTTVDEK